MPNIFQRFRRPQVVEAVVEPTIEDVIAAGMNCSALMRELYADSVAAPVKVGAYIHFSSGINVVNLGGVEVSFPLADGGSERLRGVPIRIRHVAKAALDQVVAGRYAEIGAVFDQLNNLGETRAASPQEYVTFYNNAVPLVQAVIGEHDIAKARLTASIDLGMLGGQLRNLEAIASSLELRGAQDTKRTKVLQYFREQIGYVEELAQVGSVQDASLDLRTTAIYFSGYAPGFDAEGYLERAGQGSMISRLLQRFRRLRVTPETIVSDDDKPVVFDNLLFEAYRSFETAYVTRTGRRDRVYFGEAQKCAGWTHEFMVQPDYTPAELGQIARATYGLICNARNACDGLPATMWEVGGAVNRILAANSNMPFGDRMADIQSNYV
ncbi:MAG: hypothetical protein ABIG95_01545 [Candidatus Woesearchaeota archaeon]